MAAPSAVTTKDNASKQVLKQEWAKQNPGKTKWAVIQLVKTVVAAQPPATMPTHTFAYTIFVYDNAGTQISSTYLGTDSVDTAVYYTPALISAQMIKLAAYKKAVAALKDFASNASSQYNKDPENESDFNFDTPLPDKASLERVNYNPPPHRATRSPSLYYMANIERNFKKDSASYVDRTQGYNAFTSKNQELLPLGRIYQTESTAKVLNKRYLQEKQGMRRVTDAQLTANLQSGRGLWGFRFLYNPTTISYSNSVDTSIDWIANVQDPSRFFGGNVTVNFDLYLNRMADLSTLKNSGGKIISTSGDYPGYDLTDEQARGIYYRGTEYDLEYLYRCVNGVPMRTSLTSQSLDTADFGYITGSPLWLHLHDNLRYKASLSNISVNHVSFSDRMVPMLTVVSLSFIRYPELQSLGADENAIRDALDSRRDTSATPPTGKTGQ